MLPLYKRHRDEFLKRSRISLEEVSRFLSDQEFSDTQLLKLMKASLRANDFEVSVCLHKLGVIVPRYIAASSSSKDAADLTLLYDLLREEALPKLKEAVSEELLHLEVVGEALVKEACKTAQLKSLEFLLKTVSPMRNLNSFVYSALVSEKPEDVMKMLLDKVTAPGSIRIALSNASKMYDNHLSSSRLKSLLNIVDKYEPSLTQTVLENLAVEIFGSSDSRDDSNAIDESFLAVLSKCKINEMPKYRNEALQFAIHANDADFVELMSTCTEIQPSEALRVLIDTDVIDKGSSIFEKLMRSARNASKSDVEKVVHHVFLDSYPSSGGFRRNKDPKLRVVYTLKKRRLLQVVLHGLQLHSGLERILRSSSAKEGLIFKMHLDNTRLSCQALNDAYSEKEVWKMIRSGVLTSDEDVYSILRTQNSPSKRRRL